MMKDKAMEDQSQNHIPEGQALIALYSEMRQELRSRREPEFFYTAATITAYGAAMWGVAAVAASNRQLTALPKWLHPALVAAAACLALAIAVIVKILKDHKKYDEIYKAMLLLAEEIKVRYGYEQAFSFPPGSGGGYLGSISVVIAGLVPAVVFCLSIWTITK